MQTNIETPIAVTQSVRLNYFEGSYCYATTTIKNDGNIIARDVIAGIIARDVIAFIVAAELRKQHRYRASTETYWCDITNSVRATEIHTYDVETEIHTYDVETDTIEKHTKTSNP